MTLVREPRTPREGSDRVAGDLVGPGQRNTEGSGEQSLELGQQSVVRVYLGRFVAAGKAERRERAGGLADRPLDRVQPVAAVGDVGDAEVLARRQQVLACGPGSARPAGSGTGSELMSM